MVRIAILTLIVLSSFLLFDNPVNGSDNEKPEQTLLSFDSYTLENSFLSLQVSHSENKLIMKLNVISWNLPAADGPYLYQVELGNKAEKSLFDHLEKVQLSKSENQLTLQGTIAGLDITQSFKLDSNRPILEEIITLQNLTNSLIEITNLEMGFTKKATDASGAYCTEIKNDRWIAIPFRHRADDPIGYFNDFSLTELFALEGYEPQIEENLNYQRIPSRHRFSEGWAWRHGDESLGIFKFDQENMEFSVLSKLIQSNEKTLRFGGACMISGEPAALTRIAPKQKMNLGVNRYQIIPGDFNQTLYAFRNWLDDQGCRFPADYNPPVHWNQLYNMNEAWNDRANRYTKKNIEQEAAKARAHHCEALYLDPGWDTDFGTFLWGEQWLGPRKEFIQEIQSTYGLKLALHCPLATWMSGSFSWGIKAVDTWPKSALREKPPVESKAIPGASDEVKSKGPLVCLGSQSYLEEAARRLKANCADGAVFLMFDGNWWNGGCVNPNHGHPVPYRWEDQIRACVELAQQVHAQYPQVLIEMHDMLAGGSRYRITPVYYKYGLPGSYDENWGFELMWDPLVDIKEGRGSSLYYYNMSCNVPIYLHVDLRKDNANCLVLWWFASTCRHLGIGGTHADPKIVAAQQQAMQWYQQQERFYKRGDFYGINEEIHLHVLPAENAFVVNLFNLSNETRTVAGQMDLSITGLDLQSQFNSSEPWGNVNGNRLEIQREMPPWSAQVALFKTLPTTKLSDLKPLACVELKGSLDHVQGIVVEEKNVWVSSVDRKQKCGYIHRFNNQTGELMNQIQILSENDRYHVGGMSGDGSTLWIPVATYSKEGQAFIECRDKQTLKLLHRFEVNDHIGCVAVDGDRLIGANWDALQIYIWDKQGNLIQKLNNPTPNHYQDMKVENGFLVASGLLQEQGAIDWLNLKTLEPVKRILGGNTNRGVSYMEEGMAIVQDRLYLLPEDGPTRLFVFQLP